jgi:hypothetical protein
MPNSRQRAQKPSLKRSKPIRSWSKAFGAGSAPKSAKAPAKAPTEASAKAQTEASTKASRGTVADGVRLGYQVIDDYLAKGQEAARTLGGAGGETLKAASTEVQRLTQRMFQYASDLASAWMELVQTMTANGMAANGVASNGMANEETAAKDGTPPGTGRVKQAAAPVRETASDPADLPCAVSLEIDSPLPTETTVDLRRRAIDRPVDVQPLASDDPASPRITAVSIEPLPKAGRVLVRLRVPPKQPPGLYRGLIIDRASNLPCGTLALRVGRASA